MADADQCISINPTWAKGYSRRGAALHAQHNFDEAKAAYEKGMQPIIPSILNLSEAGLEIDPSNDALKSGLQSVERDEAMNMGPAGGLGNLFGPQSLERLKTHPTLKNYTSVGAHACSLTLTS